MLPTKSIRIWLFIHTWTSLVSIAFLLMLCLTGMPLIFHDEIDAWLDPPADPPAVSTGASEPSVGTLTKAYEQRHPGKRVLFLTFDPDRRAVTISGAPSADSDSDEFAIERVSLMNGAIVERLDQPKPGIMDVILRLHVDMFAGLPGTLFLGVMGAIFVASLVSGAVLYLPYMGQRPFGEVRKRSRRIVWLDLHNMVGMVLLVWMLTVAVTGIVNTLAQPLFETWRAGELARLTTLSGSPASHFSPDMDRLVAAAVGATKDGRRASFIAAPTTTFTTNTHYVVFLAGQTPLTSRLVNLVFVNATTGSVDRFAQPPWYISMLLLSQPLHFGNYGGLPLKALWAAMDIWAIVILLSGLYLWLGKYRSRRLPSQYGVGAT